MLQRRSSAALSKNSEFSSIFVTFGSDNRGVWFSECTAPALDLLFGPQSHIHCQVGRTVAGMSCCWDVTGGTEPRPDLCLAKGGGGIILACLRTRQPTHAPKQTHPPTHPPRPPYPPPKRAGGGGVLCCYTQLVTEKPCVFPPQKTCPSVTVRSLNRNIAHLP